jgi:stress response protein YsnF
MSLPFWGEEIIIDKKMVKLGEVIIKKYKTTDNQKIDIDVKTEKITIKYPDNHKEEII